MYHYSLSCYSVQWMYNQDLQTFSRIKTRRPFILSSIQSLYDLIGNLISHSAQKGYWIDICFQSTNTHISSMLFANDVMVFGKVTLQNVQYMLNVIDLFCYWSGQGINYAKSNFIASDNLPPDLHQFQS